LKGMAYGPVAYVRGRRQVRNIVRRFGPLEGWALASAPGPGGLGVGG
jgi:hypothetical protein